MAAEETTPVLEFRSVTIVSTSQLGASICEVDFTLAPGELALVRLEYGNEHTPLADAAEGLVAPDGGEVRLQGRNWRRMSADRQTRLRGRIGRVFQQHGWISNLDIVENITLSQRHHTTRPFKAILEEARQLAAGFGLQDLPEVRPSRLHQRDLRRAEWVRAFAGEPLLIILEQPLLGVPVESAPLLVDAANAARARGAAVLWTTASTPAWNDTRLSDARRYVMRGERMHEEERE